MAQATMTFGETQYDSRWAIIWSWITTTDHKRIAKLYLFTSLSFFMIAGLLALLVRTQLIVPESGIFSNDTYNQLFTMHGLMMIFVVVMPLNAAFFNFLIPLMIGARDVAFPRLNAMSYWAYLFGALLLVSSFLKGAAPDNGWFAYANLTNDLWSPGRNMDFYMMGLQVLGISSIGSALNFLVTIINCRAPGMRIMRMPLFPWMTIITSVMMLLAFPSLTVGLIELMFDRYFGTGFFEPGKGGDPVLWANLFWVFGHPEVYILILPAFGIISELAPVFARKPLFGYPFLVYSGIAIGMLAFGVWLHHMFTIGFGPVPDSVFATTSMLIAIPTGVKIFNWLGTFWDGSIIFTTPCLYTLGFIAMFTIGGISGVFEASVPVDYWQHNSYFVVSHFHYVLFGGAIMAAFGGLYYWFPKMFGRMMSERIGKWQFWATLIFFNITFFPMMLLGVDGMPRRIATYTAASGWGTWNMVETIGAYGLGLSVLLLLGNFLYSIWWGEVANADPWDARTLEWSIPSPPPVYNFASVPVVHSRDPWWELKQQAEMNGGSAEQVIRDAGVVRQPTGWVHMPPPSFFPALVALGLAVCGTGMVFLLWPITGIGGFAAMVGLYGWALEPNGEPIHYDAPAQDVPGDSPFDITTPVQHGADPGQEGQAAAP